MNSSPNARAKVVRESRGDQFVRATLVTPQELLPQKKPIVTLVPEHELQSAHSLDPIGDAYRAGVEAGTAEAIQSAELESVAARQRNLEELAQHLMAEATSLAEERKAVLDEVVSEAVDLVFELLRVLVGEELELHEDPTREAVMRALAIAPADGELLVRLHPGSGLAAWELESMLPGRHIRVVDDPNVDPLGCILEAGSCLIDAQLESALDRVRLALARLRLPTSRLSAA